MLNLNEGHVDVFSQHITHLDIVANQASPQRSSVETLSITLVVPFIVPYNTWLPEYILQFIYIFYFYLQSPHSSVLRVNRLILPFHSPLGQTPSQTSCSASGNSVLVCSTAGGELAALC